MRNEKLHLANYIGSVLKDSNFVYFVSYQGLAVKDIAELRNKLAVLGASCRVLKNALIAKSAEISGVSALAGVTFTGGTAVVFGSGDASAVAKCLADFGKAHEQLKAKAGMMDGALLTVADISAIAELPSKDVMRAMLLGVLQAPSRNLVSLLNAKAATILNVLNAYKDKIDTNN
ncbi:MAG: 50S ribosomal protein L10 [Victivallaceae bacterium]|nr:50S ribosomal protein L10 [Victivallaceae bacterium]